MSAEWWFAWLWTISRWSVATDGVVISYKAFGTTGAALAPFNKGRTTTHEIGHWLNLFHIWGDDGGNCNGTDLVEDTPIKGRKIQVFRPIHVFHAIIPLLEYVYELYGLYR